MTRILVTCNCGKREVPSMGRLCLMRCAKRVRDDFANSWSAINLLFSGKLSKEKS